ncbi:MAG TPA: hypothetical protein VGO58_08855 [Chitinophagaceae bacterium]|jgi:hypothetical protein|nr:hypothetical protein [Chitinophagaceae bacterium]
MKKVFLVFGIAAFSSAAAQQNDIFNIDKHLQKKADKKEEKVENLIGTSGGGAVWKVNPPYTPFILPDGDRTQRTVTPFYYNMPCVRPDLRQFRTMPNPGFGILRSFPKMGEIPNGAVPYRTYIVSK